MRALLLSAVAIVCVAGSAFAGQRGPYVIRPPVIVSPDLTAPWVVQIPPGRNRPAIDLPTYYRGVTIAPPEAAGIITGPPPYHDPNAWRGEMDPQYLPQVVEYRHGEAPGTIIIDTPHRFLYLVMPGAKALRYGVGVGRPGFEWAGFHTVTRKAEWPTWTPPAEMRKRQPWLPAMMHGGPDNPLGARALYLGSTLYRIHGTSEPWTIGQAVSSGCIRMRNEDVIDLYNRVKVGTRVLVI